ncbi:hypothetical protein ACIG87_09310 [Micromonospora sp. NPDC051925]|uniref:hypothetical protein n=1 Tax=Micromonospora sp. NPDC051925 TaxID=3364288 RepID=UPI0037C94DAB
MKRFAGSVSAFLTETDRQQQRADRQNEFAEALAKELGVDTDQVTAALDKVREQYKDKADDKHKGKDKGDRPERPSAEDRQAKLTERLDQAVKDGKLTQEQADAITKAVEAGVFPGAGDRGHHGGPEGTPDK